MEARYGWHCCVTYSLNNDVLQSKLVCSEEHDEEATLLSFSRNLVRENQCHAQEGSFDHNIGYIARDTVDPKTSQ